MFVSGVNRIRKIFSTTRGVWFGRKTESNGKSFFLTIKYEGLKCKINYTSILPSNHFQKKKKKKNWTERERERGRSLELKIDSTAVWAVPLIADQAKLNSTTDLPYFSLPLSSSLYHPFHRFTFFLSTHVEQTTARRATHCDLVASTTWSCFRRL